MWGIVGPGPLGPIGTTPVGIIKGVDGGTEGPERGAEARSAGAPRGMRSGEGAIAPPQYEGLGAMPPEI